MSFTSVLNSNTAKAPLSYTEMFSLRCNAFQAPHLNYLVTAARLNPVTSLVTIAAVAGVSLILISFTTYLYAKSFSKKEADDNNDLNIDTNNADQINNLRTTLLYSFSDDDKDDISDAIKNFNTEKLKAINSIIHLFDSRIDSNTAFLKIKDYSNELIHAIYHVVSKFSEKDAFKVLDEVKDYKIKKLEFISKALSSMSRDDYELTDLKRPSDVYDMIHNNEEQDILNAFNILKSSGDERFNNIRNVINLFSAPNKLDVLNTIQEKSDEYISAMHNVISKCLTRKTYDNNKSILLDDIINAFNIVKNLSDKALEAISKNNIENIIDLKNLARDLQQICDNNSQEIDIIDIRGGFEHEMSDDEFDINISIANERETDQMLKGQIIIDQPPVPSNTLTNNHLCCANSSIVYDISYDSDQLVTNLGKVIEKDNNTAPNWTIQYNKHTSENYISR